MKINEAVEELGKGYQIKRDRMHVKSFLTIDPEDNDKILLSFKGGPFTEWYPTIKELEADDWFSF